MAIFRIERKIFSEIDYLEYLQELEERMYAASGAKKRAEDGLHNAVMHDNKAKKLKNKYEYLAGKIKNGEYTWESLSKNGKYGSFVRDPEHRKAIEGLMEGKSNAASQSAHVQKHVNSVNSQLAKVRDASNTVARTRPASATAEGVVLDKTGAFKDLKLGQAQNGVIGLKGKSAGSGAEVNALIDGGERTANIAKKNAKAAGVGYVESAESKAKNAAKKGKEAVRKEKQEIIKETKKQYKGRLSKKKLNEEINKNLENNQERLKNVRTNAEKAKLFEPGRKGPEAYTADIPKSTKNGNSFAKASEEKIKGATSTVSQRPATSTPSNLGKTTPNKFRLNRKHALIGAGVGLGLAGAGYLYNRNKNKNKEN
jgi:hypothetical protein